MPRTSREKKSAVRLERWKTSIREAGVKMTPQRLEIMTELAASDEHPDAEIVFKAVQRRMPSVSLDTVYRTLWLLHDLGLIATLGLRRDGIRFDTNLDRHHHFHCVRCGAICDFVSEALHDLPLPDSARSLGGILDVHVEVRGICTKCQQKQPSPPPHDVPAPTPKEK